MMSRFLELLRSPPSRYGNGNGNTSSTAASAPAWGTTGGLDAVVRALTWGGDVLRLGQAGASRGVGGGALVLENGEVGGRTGRGGDMSSAEVQVQVIQTTSILVMNVKSDT